MILKTFIPIFMTSLLFFILILQLIELFANLVQYLNHEVPFMQIARVQLLYLPKCITFAVPISILFSTAFTMGNFYSNNELISVFGAGIPIHLFIMPFIVTGFLLSIFSFSFEEFVTIETLKKKNTLTSQLLRRYQSAGDSNVTILSSDKKIVYHADFFNSENDTLSGVQIIIRDDDLRVSQRIDAQWAQWKNNFWSLHDATIYLRKEDSMTEDFHPIYENDMINVPPQTFKNKARSIEGLRIREAAQWIQTLKTSGLPYRAVLTDYYERYSFALTPLIMILISAPIGSRLKKNILLMSLLLSLIIAVIYYVMQMLTALLAEFGIIDALAAALIPACFFFLIGIFLLHTSRT
jgi:lipopolysaccharide export system permease protein